MTDAQLEQLLVLDGAPGPALALDAAQADAIIDAALAGAGFGPGGGPGAGGGGARAGLAGSAKLAIVAGALAVVVLALLALRRSHGPAQVAAVIPDAAIDAEIDAPNGAAEPTIEPEPAIEPEPTIEPDPTPAPSHTKPSHREPSARETADLLGEANAKRAAKQWRESDALYARVVQRAPKSLAAQTALIASASLHLEHLGDPRGAAQRFRRALALAPTGALAEEARWGIAEAARANHDTAAEAAALDDFVAHHPKSPLAPRARARRAELP